MYFDSENGTISLLLFEFALAISLFYLSSKQPFPEPSRRFSFLILFIASVMAIGQTAPNPVELQFHLAIISGIGAFGLVAGVYHLGITRRDVLIAPFSGAIFCVSVAALMATYWGDLTKFEQFSGFFAIVVMGGGQTWLVFRGLLIGKLPLAWSQAGMVALQKGKLHGNHGAIACFEKGWDIEEEHLNPMAYLALERIYKFLDDDENSSYWRDALIDAGGDEAVATEFINAVENALIKMDPNSSALLEEG